MYEVQISYSHRYREESSLFLFTLLLLFARGYRLAPTAKPRAPVGAQQLQIARNSDTFSSGRVQNCHSTVAFVHRSREKGTKVSAKNGTLRLKLLQYLVTSFKYAHAEMYLNTFKHIGTTSVGFRFV
jgi:hypothetical protein